MIRRLIFTLMGALLMLAGLALCMDAGLYVTRAAVLDRLAVDPAYLDANSQENAATFNVAAIVAGIADQRIRYPVPTIHITIYIPFLSGAPEKALLGTPAAGLAAIPTPSITGQEQSSPYPGPTPSTASQEKTIEFGQPIVNLRIKALKINRAVVDIGLANGPDGMNWDTESLFATRNRRDLVGHLEGSALPGEGGNIVLVGHNYDYVGDGVFVNLQSLKVGDKIILTTEDGSEHDYQVVKVKSVSYTGNSNIDFQRHFRFLGLTNGEQLTLVSCGGVMNIAFFNRRVYVVAVPVS